MERRKLIRSMALGMGGLMLAPEVLKATPNKVKDVLTVAHITDVHIREDLNAPERFKKSLKQIITRHKPDFFLNGGDSIYDASYSHVKRERVTALWDIWDDCIATISNKYEVYSCIGNHDPWWAAPAKDDNMYGIPYVVQRLKIPERYYSIQKGKWHFIVLDGNNKGITLDDEQYKWLEDKLQQVPSDEFVVLMSHYPLLGATIQFEGGGHGDFKKLKNLFYKQKSKVRLFLSGHNHLLDETIYNNVRYCCNGAMSGFWWEPGNKESAGPSFFQETAPGYAILKLNPNGTLENKYYPHGF